jgi:hypothetical protein
MNDCKFQLGFFSLRRLAGGLERSSLFVDDGPVSPLHEPPYDRNSEYQRADERHRRRCYRVEHILCARHGWLRALSFG